MALAMRREDNVSNLSVDFDAREDVLYLSLGTPVASYADEGPSGVLLRRANATDRPSGVTAFDFRMNWLERRPAFYALVADYLGIPVPVVRDEIESAL
jgi:hypothetical protein